MQFYFWKFSRKIAKLPLPMSLTAKIDADIKKAMLAKDAERLSVLRMLKSAVKYATIEIGGADAVATDDNVQTVLRKEVKKREDSIAKFTEGGRAELADKERQEIAVLREYMPKAPTAEEMKKIVEEAIAEVGAKGKAQMGAVIKAAQAKHGNSLDGKVLSQLVGAILK
jgi:uncharacterized protein YqeY